MGYGPGKFIKGLLIVVVALFLFGEVIMLLWNGLIPELFHGPILSYWQAVGLLVLSKLLLGGFHGGGRGGRRSWGKKKWERHEWEGGPGHGKWSWTMSNEDPQKDETKDKV